MKVFLMIARDPRGIKQEGPAAAPGEAREGRRRRRGAADDVRRGPQQGHGYMDLEEFMEVHNNGVQLGDIRRAFFVFDRNGDGRISAEEIMTVLRKLGESCSLESCRKMVREIDGNGDGFVDMDDFMAMMTRPRRKL
ncbi:hypothetical protein PVAP13_2NG356100 [Panicum virgatum]|uniref:EF-hand domain-containing protein n=1 Tax=Panicum virgatum TaxID=38727 RepID=A0A8T0VKS1_PANVG|nr:hypothetical protein PVAP13_2NG356100 [Panicum virgatum]